VQAYYHEVLADPPQETLDLDWDVGAFANLAAEVHPRAEALWSDLEVSVAPGGSYGASLFLGPPALVSLGSSYNVVTTVAYGNPFPPEWPEVLQVATTFDVPHTLAGGIVADVFADISYTVAKGAALRLAPPIGPVWDLRINGMPAVGDLDGVTTTPTISWILPRIGTPSSYIVTIARFETYEDFAFDLPVLAIHTKAESVTVPDGVMKAGWPHVIKVTAVDGPALDLTLHPLRAAVPTAKADTVSGLVTP